MATVRSYLETLSNQAGMSLLFATGERPSAIDIERILASETLPGRTARISHRPDAQDCGLELLASGLTFDLAGLSPGEGSALPPMKHQFGIAFDPAQFQFEAIAIAPARHIAGGGGLLPVVRAMIGIAATIALPLPVKAICWHPAQSWMEPAYFSRVVENWLSGGAFPALGLAAVDDVEGGIQSRGLSFFSGQEVRVEGISDQSQGETVKLAVRVMDRIIRQGALEELVELEGPAGETIIAEPSHDGNLVRVWRSVVAS